MIGQFNDWWFAFSIRLGVGNREWEWFPLPTWPWRLLCRLRGHDDVYESRYAFVKVCRWCKMVEMTQVEHDGDNDYVIETSEDGEPSPLDLKPCTCKLDLSKGTYERVPDPNCPAHPPEPEVEITERLKPPARAAAWSADEHEQDCDSFITEENSDCTCKDVV